MPVQVHEMSGYGMYGMGDLFAEYDGQIMSYDAIGNPLYDGQWSYTWAHGRELMSMVMVDGDFTWEFTYDANGMRTRRTDGVMDYRYIYNGSQLSQLTVTDDWQQTHVLYFAYSADGTPLSVTYNGTTYYYVTNIQGDVVAILDAAGNSVVTYTYDAWGNPLTTGGSMEYPLGFFNPLRYRGYVYDQETNLYYLQSRYYNSEWCRFLNADRFVSTGQGVLGNNMFAYCGNNPIMFVDPTGASWLSFFSPIIAPLAAFIDWIRLFFSTVSVAQQKDYDDFLDALAMRESSGNHDAVNPYGYQGLYQMGTPALIDAGFMNSSGQWTALANSYGVCSQDTYLNNPAAQKVAVTNYHKKVCGYIRNYGLDQYIGTYYQGVKVTRSGLVAACHLVGIGNIIDALKYDIEFTDGNGVPASEYMSVFANYNMAVVWGD